jgi:hypothetical protein
MQIFTPLFYFFIKPNGISTELKTTPNTVSELTQLFEYEECTKIIIVRSAE